MTENDVPYLGPLLASASQLRREAVRRRKPFDEKGVSADGIAAHQADGWEVDRQLKRVTKLRREKVFQHRRSVPMGLPSLADDIEKHRNMTAVTVASWTNSRQK